MSSLEQDLQDVHLILCFLEDFKIYSGLWPLSVSPRCQCVYTMAYYESRDNDHLLTYLPTYLPTYPVTKLPTYQPTYLLLRTNPPSLYSNKTHLTVTLCRSQSFREPGSPRLTRADRQNSSPPECPSLSPAAAASKPAAAADQANAVASSSGDGGNDAEKPKKRLQRVEILKIVDSEPMIEPSQVFSCARCRWVQRKIDR